MKVFVASFMFGALLGCQHIIRAPLYVIAIPYYIVTAPQRYDMKLEKLIRAEERAILVASTADEVAIHEARRNLYMDRLKMSQAERYRRKQAWERRWRTTQCTGHINQGGYWQAKCREMPLP